MSSINQAVFNVANNLRPDIDNPSPNFFNKHVTSRVYHFLAIPVEIITRLADAVLGVAGLLAALFTFGQFSSINIFTLKHLKSADSLVPSVIKHVLSFLNPSTKMNEIVSENDPILGSGITTIGFLGIMAPPMDYCSNSSNPLVEHILGRLLALVTAVGILVTKVADIALGCIATVFSLVTLGTWTHCNDLVAQEFKLVSPLAMSGIILATVVKGS